mgnify:FL=1
MKFPGGCRPNRSGLRRIREEREKGTMMKGKSKKGKNGKTDGKYGQNSRNSKNPVVFLGAAALCVLCCGCGKKEATLLIGGGTQSLAGESGSMEDFSGEGVSPGGQEGAAPGKVGGESAYPDTELPDTEPLIRVYVCGAVANPGVVEIPGGSRAEDALLAAGGFGEEAARDAVNLADWVSDGQKLYFPAEGEEILPLADSGDAGTAAGLVNINTADAAALCTLPGVGESRAVDIIAWREANGGFDSCEDIMKVPGIKNAVYEKLKDKIAVK